MAFDAIECMFVATSSPSEHRLRKEKTNDNLNKILTAKKRNTKASFLRKERAFHNHKCPYGTHMMQKINIIVF